MWILKLLPLLATLALVLGLYWYRLQRAESPREMTFRWIITALIAMGLCAVSARSRNLGILLSLAASLILIIVWRRALGEIMGNWISSLYSGGDATGEARPIYSIAEARRKQGKYIQAMEAVEEQLARFPTDFQGWMMLAEIRAEDLKDLEGAQEVVQQILDQPSHAPKNIAYALTREADWHLKLRQDRDAAQTALERIILLLPDTEEAQWARQRIAHLAAPERLAEKKAASTVAIRPGETNVGLRSTPLEIRPPEADPGALAAGYVKQLEQFPHDIESREKLAVLYAKSYQRLDLAMDQLEQLIAFPNQPPKQVIHWLNLMADLQIEIAGDAQLAREALQRIVDQFPKTAAAGNAINRIAHLKLELRPRQASQVVKLGNYEQNIGLNSGARGKRGPG